MVLKGTRFQGVQDIQSATTMKLAMRPNKCPMISKSIKCDTHSSEMILSKKGFSKLLSSRNLYFFFYDWQGNTSHLNIDSIQAYSQQTTPPSTATVAVSSVVNSLLC